MTERNEHQSGRGASVRERASDWAARASFGLTPEEQAELDAWLNADPSHRQVFHTVKHLWDAAVVGEALGVLEAEGAADGPAPRAAPPRPSRSVPRFRVAGAAIAAGLMIVIVGVATARLGPRASAPAPVATAFFETYETATAELREIALPDGSTATLGAETRLSVLIDAEERRARLEAGEAFFTVSAAGDGRAFVVSAGDVVVRVLGTQFDVRLARDTVRVGVLEGTVEVTTPDVPPSRAREPGATAQPLLAVLEAGDHLVTSQGQVAPAPAPAQDTPPGAWRDGRLIYNAASLAQVVSDADRYYERDIALASEDLGALRVTASFRTDDIEAMIDLLATELPVSVHKQTDGDILLMAATNQ